MTGGRMPKRKDTFVLTDATKQRLGRLAHFHERSMSAHIRWMIDRDYLALSPRAQHAPAPGGVVESPKAQGEKLVSEEA
jgi:hypothetical protein